jgi:hypothetical protein
VRNLLCPLILTHLTAAVTPRSMTPATISHRSCDPPGKEPICSPQSQKQQVCSRDCLSHTSFPYRSDISKVAQVFSEEATAIFSGRSELEDISSDDTSISETLDMDLVDVISDYANAVSKLNLVFSFGTTTNMDTISQACESQEAFEPLPETTKLNTSSQTEESDETFGPLEDATTRLSSSSSEADEDSDDDNEDEPSRHRGSGHRRPEKLGGKTPGVNVKSPPAKANDLTRPPSMAMARPCDEEDILASVVAELEEGKVPKKRYVVTWSSWS